MGQIGGAICGSVSNGSVDLIYSIAMFILTTYTSGKSNIYLLVFQRTEKSSF